MSGNIEPSVEAYLLTVPAIPLGWRLVRELLYASRTRFQSYTLPLNSALQLISIGTKNLGL